MNSNMAEYLFHEGTNYHSHKFLGSFLEGDSCTFRVWAPNAKRVFVTGEFCSWYPYKYVILTHSGVELWKADPYAKHAETRPLTASKVYTLPEYKWKDKKWMDNRTVPYHQPMNFYEVHL